MSKKVVENLDLVYSLIHSFDKSEVLVLHNFLSAFESRKKGFKPKGVILLELILKHDSSAEVLTRFRKKLGQDSLDSSRMHINRLRDKTFESMALEVNIQREGAVSITARGQHQILSKRFITQLLDIKGHRELSNRVLNQAIKLTKEFEFYSDLLELLYIVRERTRGTALLKQHDKVNKEIAFYKECQMAVWRSKDIVEDLSAYRVKLVSMADLSGAFRKAISEALPKLEKDFELTGSAKIGTHYYTFQCELYQLNEQYEEAIESFNHWLDLTKNNASVKGDVRISSIHLNIGQNSVFAYRFDEALRHVNLAYGFLAEGSKFYYTGKEQEFYALFYNGISKDAVSIAHLLSDAAVKHGFKNKGPVWNFFAAAAEYVAGNYKVARRCLRDTGVLRTDREGFNIAIRVFEIILDIDSEKFDVADSQINNLRQFIKEGLKDSEVRKRDQLILQILLDLRRASYNFADLEESTLALWRELFGKDKAVNWIPECAELVPFHIWFTYKHRDVPYDSALTSKLIHTPYI
jgi:tetratricopeptide (TPR) repeat protein